MAIRDLFELTKPREFKGQKTFRLYEFQIYFGISLLLEKEEIKEPYCLLMDYYDDVVIMDNKDKPEVITFYQVKTNEKEKISLSTIVTKKYLERMCYNLDLFSNENSKAVFVTNSNVPFNMNSKKSSVHVEDFKDFDFNNLKPVSISNILKDNDKKIEAINKIKASSGCSFNPDDVFLLKTDFSIDGFEDNIKGKVLDYLMKNNSCFDVVSANSLVQEIHNQLLELQKCRYTPLIIDYDAVIKNKAFTNENFSQIENDLKNRLIPNDFHKVYEFAKESLSYLFNCSNFLELKILYNDFTIDSVKNKEIYSYIIKKICDFECKGVQNDELLYKINEMLLKDSIISNSEFYKKYYEFIIVVFIYKI